MRVRPGRLITAAACCAAALATAPASIAQAASTGGALSTGAGADSSGSAATTRVTLTADPARPAVGQPVRLTLAAPPTDAGGFAWDLAGRGAYVRHTGDTAETDVSCQTPGIHSVAVRFKAGSQVRLGVLQLTVAARPVSRAPHAAHADRPSRAHTGLTGRVTAHVAGDPGVAIADFHFTPAATTIHVGDTITWSNSGPSSHTATATNGSFDTGILKKGQSASHTFTQAGTYNYACQIHPFVHGMVVVEASTTSTTTSSAGTAPATTTPTTTAAAQTGPALPNTGFNALAGLFAGLVLLGLGARLRRTRAR
jgi:LPXTG-motif cell wall-anchored protein